METGDGGAMEKAAKDEASRFGGGYRPRNRLDCGVQLAVGGSTAETGGTRTVVLTN